MFLFPASSSVEPDRAFRAVGFFIVTSKKKAFAPERQGHIDGMCAIYAVLNACKLLFEHSEAQDLRLFRELCRKNPQLFPRIVYAGTEVGGVARLLAAAKDWVWREHGRELRFTRPARSKRFDDPEAFFTFLRDVVATKKTGEKTAAIIGIDHPWDHWTAVRSIGPRRVAFFDSWRFPARTAFDYFTLDRKSEDAKHKALLAYRQTFVLRALPGEGFRRSREKSAS